MAIKQDIASLHITLRIKNRFESSLEVRLPVILADLNGVPVSRFRLVTIRPEHPDGMLPAIISVAPGKSIVLGLETSMKPHDELGEKEPLYIELPDQAWRLKSTPLPKREVLYRDR